jgi:hypothetical protein
VLVSTNSEGRAGEPVDTAVYSTLRGTAGEASRLPAAR